MHTVQPLLLIMFIFCLSPQPSTMENISSLQTVHDLHSRLTTYGADVCKHRDIMTETDLLIVVNSITHNMEDRQRSRFSWLSHWTSRDTNKVVSVVFFVGKPKSLNQAESLAAENALYHDIVWTNLEETESYSTLKATSWLNWVIRWCPRAKFVLKVDENEIVNLPAVIEFINRNKNVTNTIWGFVLHDGILKWFERLLFYPDYCSKQAYLMTRDVVKKLLIGGLKPIPYNAKEHIYFTGIVAKKEGIHVINNNKFKEIALPLKLYISEIKANHTSHERCMLLKYNMIFSTTENKEEWPAHWTYIMWALNKCNIRDKYDAYQ